MARPIALVEGSFTGLTLGDYSLPLFNAPTGNVDAADVSHMTNFNDSIAASTRIISGRIISGIGPLSLNNPPLENLIVEIITTSVRKATEKASWCWYACNLDQDIEKQRKDAEKAAKDMVKRDVKDAEEKVVDPAHKKVEHVKVRFKVSK